MIRRVKHILSYLLLVSLICGMLPGIGVHAAVDTSAVGQLSDSFTANSDTFTLTDTCRLFVVASAEPSGILLETVQLIQRQFAAAECPTGSTMDLVWGPESWITEGDIVLCLDSASGIGAEGYSLEVTNTARVTASDADGLLYGANMLLKHIRNADSNSIQGFVSTDVPDTAQRAVSLDCGRKYYTKEWICNFIREMSWMGYNTLELHFSDDSGFRIDIWDEAYYTDTYQPANDFSWICGSNYTSWTLSAYQNDPDKGKYLTADEVIEILDTAREYHIDVIPAFDSPSHLDYMTWTYEQNYKNDPEYAFYSTYDNKTYYAADVNGIINYTNSSGWSTPLKWPYYSTISIVDDHAKAFVFELYLDIADFFKTYAGSEDFSIGADEVNLSTSNLASGYSFTWEFSDFVDYINELNQLLNGKGYTMRMYNDFMGSTAYSASSYDFADNIEIMYWDSPFDPNSGGAGTKTEPVSYYVDKGSTIYNCIQTNTYYALRITGGGSDARSLYNRQWTFYHSNEEDIYDEWYPADISEHGDYSEDTTDVPEANLGGAYFLIWCDYACVSTEAEIWNGCYDATSQNTGEFYSLRDRMWSNTVKMWNWDINDTVTYSAYASVRDAYGDFPGCGTGTNACSEKTVLPTATQISSGYAGGCTQYPSYCQIKVTADSSVMTLPCSTETEASSVVMETAYAEDVYTAARVYENTEGELWYKVRTKTGQIGYLKASDTVYVNNLTDDITVTGATTPSGHVKGSIFQIKGDIQSKYNTLTSVAVYVYSGFGTGGTVITGDSAQATDNYYSLLNSTIDYNTAFNQVPLGNNTYVITADYQSYYVNDGQVVDHTGKVTLVEKCFVVLSASVDQSTCSHSYSESVLHKATCYSEGVMVYACSVCGYVYEQTISSSGHTYTAQTLDATCTTYESVCYTCSVCGYSYTAYPESIMSDWQESKPEGVAEELIEEKDVYRYSDYETVTSGETSLEGYTQIGSAWVKKESGTVQYVNSWPTGFDTTSQLYIQYNNIASKVTASETETTKRVIDSDKVTGYLYYHWCYSNSYYSVSAQSGRYTVFHAYYSTVAPGNYTCDYSDMSYCTAHSTCSNSDWYFVASVYAQKYTDYTKEYTYARWSDWSEWSDTPVSATSTRKVESQHMYRYVNGSFAAHQWSNGICGVCQAVCDHTFRNNICTVCGMAKPVKEYFLFGYINGANYGCEEDFENLGEFCFVDGTVVAFFDQDCYVAIKSGDNADWYMTDGWQGFVSSATLYNTTKLTTSDKLYVPGNTQVTFTLVDNGDDTYQLSYVTADCTHEKHSVEGICNLCGQTVEHTYTDGYCSCGLACEHSMENGYCTICGAECDHQYQNNVCTLCGASKPVQDLYLFGYINGANYGFEEDYQNLGEYKFVEGQLEVYFSADSYVAVKSADNENWYMTAGWQDFVSSATLYNSKDITDTTPDKLFVPGKTQVTFTLTDNGDDTYVLSYTVAECPHDNHDTDGACLTCGESVAHNYVSGFCSCGKECDHQFTDSVCTLCGVTCSHSYQNNVCAVCGASKPVLDYYLFGYINGADYACEGDSANLGEYLFVDGQLTAYFSVASYVGVKGSDNLSWYMTDGWVGEVSSATLYNTAKLSNSDKLYVPGNMLVTFTLKDNGDDTYELSYTAQACPHSVHLTDGICTVCGGTVDHQFADGFCSCGLACTHSYVDGICSICAQPCTHSWLNGQCSICHILCDHEWSEGVCLVCGKNCVHSWQDGVCTGCSLVCAHRWENGQCTVCDAVCTHTYQNNTCTNCGFAKPAVDYYLFGIINGSNYAYEEDAANLGEYKFVDGELRVIFRQDGYVGVKASDRKGWYMTDGDMGQASSAVLFNTAAITTGELLWVPGCMQIVFSLTDNGDDTLTLSYTAAECPHESHGTDGLCLACGTAVSHSYFSETIAPTCTEEGSVTYTCEICSGSYTEAISALGHDYEVVITAPTCTEPGYTTYTCRTCGDSYVSDGTAATGHTYETVTVDATCTTDGSITDTCTVCGDTQTQTVPATGHSHEAVVTAPTCTESGYTTYICACGDSYTADEAAATGHTYETVTVDATCTTDGSITDTCTVCGDTQTQTIPATGHSHEAVVTAPTCTENGYTTYTCACGDSYTADEVASLGHDYADGYCSVCGEAQELPVPTVKLQYPTLSFEDEILINVYFSAENLEGVVQMGMITYSNQVASWSVDTADAVIPGYAFSETDSFYYSTTNGIPAKCLGDTVYFSIYMQLEDGSYLYSQLQSYSPVTYAYRQLENANTSQAMKTLVVAMLNYGAAAQNYFNYRTDALVNSGLTAQQLEMVDAYSKGMMDAVIEADVGKAGEFAATENGFAKKYPTVSFEGAFSINYYFTPSASVEGDLKLYYWNQSDYEKAELLTADNATGILTMAPGQVSEYHTAVEGIAAKELDRSIFVAAVYSDGTQIYCSGVLSYHIGSYCDAQAAVDSDMREFAELTAVYGYYAKAYFVG